MPVIALWLGFALLQQQSATARYFPSPAELPATPCSAPSDRFVPPADKGAVSEFENSWYSRHLAAAKESSLYRQARGRSPAATLRFTWLPTFTHPVVVRVEWNAGRHGRLVAKQLSGAGGYDPGTIARTIDRSLTAGEAAKIKALLARTRFFALPVTACDRGLDGSEWLFERTDRAGYSLVKRWSPERGPARQLGETLLGLTGWKFSEIY